MNVLTNSIATRQEESLQLRLGKRIAAALLRIRFQLLGGLMLGVIIPMLVRPQFETFQDSIANYDNTVLGTLAALMLGVLFFRKMTAMPGVNALTNVIPSFMMSYGVVVSLFFLLRLDYSRYQFLLSFALVVGWFLLILFVVSRLHRPIFGFIRGGRTAGLQSIRNVDWVELKRPEDANHWQGLPIVADLRSDELAEDWQRFIAEAAIDGRQIYNAKQLRESLEGQVQVEHISENTLGHLAPDSIYAPTKRYVDGFMALAALILFSPILLLVAGLIRIDSKGPALFRQRRMGYRGQPFTVYKFRSMRVQCDSKNQREADKTLSDDDRITRVGRFIRKTRIDELPQLINVLRGEMSWIGPRPETMNLSLWYESEIPFYRYRHVVRPGITGWAQVKQGHVTEVDDVKEKLEYDFYYVKHFSLWLDVMIVIQTIKIVLTGHGAK